MTTVCVMCGKIIHGARHPAACGACSSRIVPGVPKPTIKLRIRVGVTADGSWSAIGADDRTSKGYGYSYDTTIADDTRTTGGGPIVAWHWITAEVPMPDVERGEVAGEVER